MLAALSKAEYMASVHKFRNQGPPPKMCIGTSDEEEEALQSRSGEAALGEKTEAGSTHVPALLATETHAKRKVCVLQMMQ